MFTQQRLKLWQWHSENLLAHAEGQLLIDPYASYQHLMDYWAETMQDDAYLISSEGWKAETYRMIETNKQGKQKDKGWTCDLVPKSLVVARRGRGAVRGTGKSE